MTYRKTIVIGINLLLAGIAIEGYVAHGEMPTIILDFQGDGEGALEERAAG